MILLVKFSGSHCNSPIICWMSINDEKWSESWENLPLEFHGLSISSIQFAEIIVVRILLNLLLPRFNKIFSHFSPAEHRVGEDVDFGSGSLSIPTPNLGNWSGLCQWFLFDHWSAFLFPWIAVPLSWKDNSLQVSHSCQSLFRDEPLLEERYSWTFRK